MYAITDLFGHVKIGITIFQRVQWRLSCLQTGNPFEIKIGFVQECEITDGRSIEERAHRALREYRVRGEWFKVPLEKAITAIETAAKQEEEHQARLVELAKANDAINEKREREAKALQGDIEGPEQSPFDMMLGEGNFAPETRRKRSIFDD